MKRTRQLHLWIGLICSIFILIESVTGLLLSERWLVGSGGMDMKPPQAITQSAAAGQDSGASDQASANTGRALANRPDGASDTANRQAFKGGDRGGEAGGVMGVIRGLHEGRIGQTDVKWLVDLTAVGMIVLTVTGITLSIKTLRAQSISRRKKQQA
ncbi:hypothetical protein GCM10023310_09070 [Paenibacillus vulneris]|uniref:PepSY-associated TM helix domain-containing protein n=1 Tax=Paenibacillus vulneris TaxID=1133364 RepID=A0ABW3UVU1_9BACL